MVDGGLTRSSVVLSGIVKFINEPRHPHSLFEIEGFHEYCMLQQCYIPWAQHMQAHQYKLNLLYNRGALTDFNSCARVVKQPCFFCAGPLGIEFLANAIIGIMLRNGSHMFRFTALWVVTSYSYCHYKTSLGGHNSMFQCHSGVGLPMVPKTNGLLNRPCVNHH